MHVNVFNNLSYIDWALSAKGPEVSKFGRVNASQNMLDIFDSQSETDPMSFDVFSYLSNLFSAK